MAELIGDILQPGEIELYVQQLSPSKIENIASGLWFEAHRRLQKLGMQSTIEARELKEEKVKDFLISYGKIPVLVHEALCIQIWRQKILRRIMKMNVEPDQTFLTHIILHHEIVVIGLLQNVVFHKDSIESFNDSVLDLIDYCTVEIIGLLAQDFNHEDKHPTDISNLEEIEHHCKSIKFKLGLTSISILSDIIKYKDDLSLSAVSRLYKSHDVPLLMANLIQMAPWKKENEKNKTEEIFDSGKWKNAEKFGGIAKYEGQCWIALYYLLLDINAMAHYEMNEFRKQHFVKLLKYLTENLIDQIPQLLELKRYLHHLSISDVTNNTRKPLLMESEPEIKSKILNEGFRKWNKITEKHLNLIFNPRKEIVQKIAKDFEEIYDIDHLERVVEEGPICSNCGDQAAKRCSQCKGEWYCGRECQVKRWPKHKFVCYTRDEKILEKANDQV